MAIFSLLEKITEKLQLFNMKRSNSPTVRPKTEIQAENSNVSADTITVSGNTNSNNTSISISKKNDLEPIRITDLVTPNYPELRNKEFINKDIWGPAVVTIGGPIEISGCMWDTEGSGNEAMFVTLNEENRKIGLIQLINCKFANCNFKGVAIAATQEQMPNIKKGFSGS